VVYAKGLLSGIAAIYLGFLLPPLLELYRGLSQQRATGLGAIAGGLGSVLSPWCWLLALSFFAVFFIISRAHNKFVRVLFFWIPTVFFSTIAVLGLSLFTYTFVHAGEI
jgi:type II secretory pathway component PulF